MRSCEINGTALTVSGLCLGTVNFGTALEEKECFQQLDQFVEAGGNFIDTAHVYGDWGGGEKAHSERIIGKWFQMSHKRNQCVISTKGGHPRIETMKISRVRKEDIFRDIEESLRYLKTDMLDIYFLHRDDIRVPVIEILGWMEELRKKGYIRYYGCSNWKLERIREAEQVARRQGVQGFVCNQLMWSLAECNKKEIASDLVLMDAATYQYHKETQMCAMAYTSMAKGFLVKKRQSRVNISEELKRVYENKENNQILKILKELELREISCTQAMVAYFFEQDFSSIPIVSFRTLEQLAEILTGEEVSLGSELIKRLNSIKHL